jgi:hypothetical protein
MQYDKQKENFSMYNEGNKIGKLVLVLLVGVIYEVHHWDGLRWNDKFNKFHGDWFGY